MKKIALTSLLAVFAVSAANAGNVISDNPLYRPSEGQFYSVTSLETAAGYDNKGASDFRMWGLGESFGYGISDKLSVYLENLASAVYPQGPMSQDNYAWDNFGLAVSYRGIDSGVAKMDVYAGIKTLFTSGAFGATSDGLETVARVWTLGTKAGVVMNDWTLAGTAEYQYLSSDNSSNSDFSIWTFGMEGEYVMSKEWSMTAGLNYISVEADRIMAQVADYAYGDKDLTAQLGVNYNIDSAKYVGLYVSNILNADTNKDAYILGAKFGIEF